MLSLTFDEWFILSNEDDIQSKQIKSITFQKRKEIKVILLESHFCNHLVFMNLNVQYLGLFHTNQDAIFLLQKTWKSGLIPNFSYWVFDLIQTLDLSFL